MNWMFIEPYSEHFGCTVVMSEEQILDWHGAKRHYLTQEEIIDDFIVVHWATRTTMPPGVYPWKHGFLAQHQAGDTP